MAVVFEARLKSDLKRGEIVVTRMFHCDRNFPAALRAGEA